MSAVTTTESKGSPGWHHAHHFDKADTQFDAAKMGIWLFLVTEILFFGGLFCALFIYRSWYFDSFVEAHHHLDKQMGALNTLFLITSSLTMALAVRASQKTDTKQTVRLLLATFAFAGAFLVVKYFEYSHKLHNGIGWGVACHPSEHILASLPQAAQALPIPANLGTFFSIYYLMTGLHGVHVVIGIGLFTWLLGRLPAFGPDNWGAVDGVALYWHLVDLVWIFLFPLFYLI